MIYLLKFRPFNNNQINNIEIFNEASILIISYILLLYTEYNKDLIKR